MLRGIQKQMIVVKPPMGSPFERAYFVLRRDRPPASRGQDDMVREAQRMLSEGRSGATGRAQRASLLWLVFGLGASCGAILSALLWLVL